MKVNTIIVCMLLWGVVELIAIIVSVLHRITLKQEHVAKKKYLQRLIELAAMEINAANLTTELYYSFLNDRRLRIILLKAIKFSPEKSFMYIYSRLGCEPMKKVHSYLLKKINYKVAKGSIEDKNPLISVKTRDYLFSIIEDWDTTWNKELRLLKKKKAMAFLEKSFAHIINLWLYVTLQTDTCLIIYVIVNTIGVVMYIIIDYECCVVDNKDYKGSLVFQKYEKKISQSFARGIENIYQLAASLGLIISITTVVMNWLGPVA